MGHASNGDAALSNINLLDLTDLDLESANRPVERSDAHLARSCGCGNGGCGESPSPLCWAKPGS